jgi:hypothetical protein
MITFTFFGIARLVFAGICAFKKEPAKGLYMALMILTDPLRFDPYREPSRDWPRQTRIAPPDDGLRNRSSGCRLFRLEEQENPG